MTVLSVRISEELGRAFKDEVYKRKGMKKGNIKEAVEEAIRDWINKKPVERQPQQ